MQRFRRNISHLLGKNTEPNANTVYLLYFTGYRDQHKHTNKCSVYAHTDWITRMHLLICRYKKFYLVYKNPEHRSIVCRRRECLTLYHTGCFPAQQLSLRRRLCLLFIYTVFFLGTLYGFLRIGCISLKLTCLQLSKIYYTQCSHMTAFFCRLHELTFSGKPQARHFSFLAVIRIKFKVFKYIFICIMCICVCMHLAYYIWTHECYFYFPIINIALLIVFSLKCASQNDLSFSLFFF